MFITAVCVIILIKLRWPKIKSLYDIDVVVIVITTDPNSTGSSSIQREKPNP